jgi:hypothetical protein
MIKLNKFKFRSTSKKAPVCHVLRVQDVDFTLAIQISWSRLWIMKHQCDRWGDNPMSLVVWLGYETENAHEGSIRDQLQDMGCNLSMIKVSVLASTSRKQDQKYPVNRLRNLAISKVTTSHTITMDADFLVSPGLYESLTLHRNVLAIDHKLALVIPALEIPLRCEPSSSPGCRNYHMQMAPVSKKHARKLKLKPFQASQNPQGHSSTRYKSWFSQGAEQLVPIKCVLSGRYEPYLVVRNCRDTPPFQEAFTGYGQNKISWIKHLRVLDFKMFRIGDGFCVHVPHGASTAKKLWRSERKRRRRMRDTSAAFDMWMQWRHAHSNISEDKNQATPLCKNK